MDNNRKKLSRDSNSYEYLTNSTSKGYNTNTQLIKDDNDTNNTINSRQQQQQQLNTDIMLLKKRNFSDKQVNPNDANSVLDEIDNIFKKAKLNGINGKGQEKIIYRQDSYNINTEMILAPWITKNTLMIKNTMIRLHNEIIDFVKYASPSEVEHLRREKAFNKLKRVILDVYPDSQVYVFGSFVTRLYLPHADIDLVVNYPRIPNTTILQTLARVLMNRKDFKSIQVIKSAKVPLIKVIDKDTNLNFDISFNKLDGVYQIHEVEKGLNTYPEMKYLIFILKSMLKQRDLNETYTGGMGSFLLFCLVLTFFREFRRKYIIDNKIDSLKKVLLSEYFMKFLEFYGINFEIHNKVIIMTDGGSISEKYTKDQALCVISPQDNTHDIGGPVYKIKEIFGVFKNRFHFLSNYNFKDDESILKYVMHSKIFEDDENNGNYGANDRN